MTVALRQQTTTLAVAAAAAVLLAASVHAALSSYRRRRRYGPLSLAFPTGAAAVRAAAQGWPTKALEPYLPLLTLAGADATVLGGVTAARVRVSFAPAHDRRPHAADAEIEAVWRRRLAQAEASGGRLFDQSKFRLQRIGWVDRRRDAVLIELGLTSYKEYVGTNQLPEAARQALEADGAREHDGDASAHLSNALGCETLLLTSDAQVVMLRRSRQVSSGEGLYNGPSGHPEPSHAGITAHEESPPAADAVADRVRAELFGSVLQEVHEETNVPLDALGAPRDVRRKL